MRRLTIVAVSAAGVLTLAACSPSEENFKDEGQDYIESDDFSQAIEEGSGIAISFSDASCEEPENTDTGTTYVCTATGDDGREYTFTVEITGDKELTVQSIDPLPGD